MILNGPNSKVLDEMGFVLQPWRPYDDDEGYEKYSCNIRLKNGEEHGPCYPNAGKFLVLDFQPKSFDSSEVAEVQYYK